MEIIVASRHFKVRKELKKEIGRETKKEAKEDKESKKRKFTMSQRVCLKYRHIQIKSPRKVKHVTKVFKNDDYEKKKLK